MKKTPVEDFEKEFRGSYHGGRPKLPKHAAKSITIQIRVTEDEMNRILRQAGNRTVTDWAREKLGL